MSGYNQKCLEGSSRWSSTEYAGYRTGIQFLEDLEKSITRNPNEIESFPSPFNTSTLLYPPLPDDVDLFVFNRLHASYNNVVINADVDAKEFLKKLQSIKLRDGKTLAEKSVFITTPTFNGKSSDPTKDYIDWPDALDSGISYLELNDIFHQFAIYMDKPHKGKRKRYFSFEDEIASSGMRLVPRDVPGTTGVHLGPDIHPILVHHVLSLLKDGNSIDSCPASTV